MPIQIKQLGAVLVSLSLVLLIFSLLRKNEPFFNLNKIIKDHLKIFEKCRGQYFIFYGIPLIFSVGLAIIYAASVPFYSEMSVVLGIFLSILLAILSILCNYDFGTVKNKTQKESAKKVVHQTIGAIVFDAMLCLFMLLYNLIIIVCSSESLAWLPISLGVIKTILAGIAYYVFLVVLLTLLLIVKQMSKIIEFNMYVERDK